jgi:hypothetical protein
MLINYTRMQEQYPIYTVTYILQYYKNALTLTGFLTAAEVPSV